MYVCVCVCVCVQTVKCNMNCRPIDCMGMPTIIHSLYCYSNADQERDWPTGDQRAAEPAREFK